MLVSRASLSRSFDAIASGAILRGLYVTRAVHMSSFYGVVVQSEGHAISTQTSVQLIVLSRRWVRFLPRHGYGPQIILRIGFSVSCTKYGSFTLSAALTWSSLGQSMCSH